MSRPCPLRVAARATPDAEALVFEGRRQTFAQWDDEVARCAAWLAARGVGAGARVGVCSWNRPEVLTLWLAASRLGAALVPLNVRLTPGELAPLIARAAPALLLVEEAAHLALPGAEPLPGGGVEAAAWAAPPLKPAPGGARGGAPSRAPGAPPSHGADEEGSLAQGRGERPPVAGLDPHAASLALFTSGTTGTPSLVELTHANVAAHVAASAQRLAAAASDRWLGTLPLFHVGGLMMAARCVAHGATLVLHRRFDAAGAARALLEERITHASFVPTSLAAVLDALESSGGDLHLRAVLLGGGPMDAALLARAKRAGVPALQTWGLTQACSQVTTEVPGEADGATAGPPVPGVEVEVRDGEGRPCPVGAPGQLFVRGPSVAPACGPWLDTGDVGCLDARGRVTVLSRRVDLIVTGGENVAPAEIESVLAAHPSVREVAVVPRPDARFGQVPEAVVALRDDGASPEALLAWCRARLAGFKVPRSVRLVDALPRNALGKVERRRLAFPDPRGDSPRRVG